MRATYGRDGNAGFGVWSWGAGCGVGATRACSVGGDGASAEDEVDCLCGGVGGGLCGVVVVGEQGGLEDAVLGDGRAGCAAGRDGVGGGWDCLSGYGGWAGS